MTSNYKHFQHKYKQRQTPAQCTNIYTQIRTVSNTYNQFTKFERELQTITNNNTDSPCQTLIDEAYVQHSLREQGYEIQCDGLDTFPTNSRDLREIIYENSNTNNQR